MGDAAGPPLLLACHTRVITPALAPWGPDEPGEVPAPAPMHARPRASHRDAAFGGAYRLRGTHRLGRAHCGHLVCRSRPSFTTSMSAAP